MTSDGATHRRGLSWPAIALLLLALLVHSGGPASARVVGILFDDSTSMAPRIHLPAFGAQVLISALDGRPGKDRLIATTLRQAYQPFRDPVSGQYTILNSPITADNIADWLKLARGSPVTRESLSSAAQQQAAIDRVATQWAEPPRFGTPYEPVELMLDELVRNVEPNEAAILIVITDGGFDDKPAPPDPDRIRASYARYKERLAAKNASLRVEFLLIAPDDPDLIAFVKQQRIRATLLESFNGSPEEGSHEVINIRELIEALKDVTARVSGSDRAQSQYIAASGATLTIDSPLSLITLTSIATARDPNPVPALTTRFANAADTRHLVTAMRQADTLDALRDIRLRGVTEQLRFQPALPPGRHTLTYDRPVGSDVFLTFATGAFTELTILAPDGTPIQPDNGVYTLSLGGDYRLQARLMDNRDGQLVPVALSSLKSKVDFTALVDRASRTRVLGLTSDRASDRAAGDFKADTVGPATITAQARIEGFVTSPSAPAAIRVVDMTGSLSVRFQPAETCPECGPGEARVTYGTPGVDQPVGTFEILPSVVRDGRAKLDLSGLPPGMSVTDDAGTALRTGDTVAIADGRRTIVRARWRVDPAAVTGRQPFRISLSAEAPLRATGEASGVLRVRVPDAALRLTGHAGGDPSVPLTLTGSDLVANGLPIDFLLANALSRPTAGQVTVSGGPPLLRYDVEVHDYTFHVRPNTGWWCVCVLGLFPSAQPIVVTWSDSSGLQTASAEARIVLSLSWPEILWSCGKILLAALVALWLFMALLTGLSTNRFPRGSVAEITEGRELPRFVPLRGRNWTFPRCLLPWPLIRPPHERQVIEGMVLEAATGGAELLLDRTSVDARLVQRSELLSDIKRDRPRQRTVKLPWRSELEREVGVLVVIRLLRSLRDRQVG